MKKCTKCGQIKRLELFGKNKRKKDGYQSFCRDCHKNYYQANKNRFVNYNKKYYIENREYFLNYRKGYYENNTEYYLGRSNEWRQKNPERTKSIAKNNRARRREDVKHNGKLNVTHDDYLRLYKQPCVFCGSDDNIEIDHVIPLVKGGKHSIGNLQALCRKCNRSKSDKYMIEFKRCQKEKGKA